MNSSIRILLYCLTYLLKGSFPMCLIVSQYCYKKKKCFTILVFFCRVLQLVLDSSFKRVKWENHSQETNSTVPFPFLISSLIIIIIIFKKLTFWLLSWCRPNVQICQIYRNHRTIKRYRWKRVGLDFRFQKKLEVWGLTFEYVGKIFANNHVNEKF